jgi:D-xylonolactonase
MGFTPDLKQFYWTCSTTRRIYRFPYDQNTGEIGDSTVFYQANDKEGITDGMKVDANGHIWSARWDGYSIVHHGPDGRVLETIPIPVAKVTSLCFGGPHYDQMFITTAGGQPGASTADGSVYHIAPAPAKGRPEFTSRILLS